MGQATYPNTLSCLKKFGLFVSFGQSSGTPSDFKLSDLVSNGSLYAQRPSLANYIASNDQLKAVSENLFQMIIEDKIKIDINQRYDLSDTADAFRALTSRETTGATILEV